MEFKEEIVKLLSKELHLKEQELNTLLETPPDQNLGDISLPCFKLSNLLKKDPKLIAIGLKDKLKISKDSIIKEIKVLGPYLNFYLNNELLTKSILTKILKEKQNYGLKKNNNKRIVIEFPSPNTNKPLHLGHLRNMALGDSISRILESQGNKVFRVNLNNDRGIHICKSMLAYKKWGSNKQPNKKSDHFVGDFYVLFAQKSKDNQNIELEAQEMLREWEKGDKETLKLWKKMNTWAINGFNETYNLFGLRKFDKVYYESKIYKKGKELILKGLKDNIFEKDEKGAVIADLKELGKKVLLREDGTSIYITQDIYLAKLKYEDFKFNTSIYVTAIEQDFHFKVLFKVLKLLNFKFADSCYHLSHGMVNLPEGRMKSREGTIVDADDLIQELTEMAKKEITKRQKIKAKSIDKIAEKIAIAALKCYLLKFTAHTDIVFNPKESISFEGETGPYLLYSLVRANKILEKAKSKIIKFNTTLISTQQEISLIKKLSEFPTIIEKTVNSYSPHILVEYSFKIAALFNLFYENCPVINAENNDLKFARTSIVQAYSVVLNSCLTLLGIEIVREM